MYNSGKKTMPISKKMANKTGSKKPVAQKGRPAKKGMGGCKTK
jgi:hypothetical protein